MKKNENWCPYIKPTRRVHDSGYRVFEVGYCIVEDATVIKKRVLGSYTDHVHLDYLQTLIEKKPINLNMDLTRDGYIRFFGHQEKLVWDAESFASSSMAIRSVPPAEGEEEHGQD